MPSLEDKKKLLLQASDVYYNLKFGQDKLMTDEEYDALYTEVLSEIPANDPFRKTIGAPPQKSSPWKKAKHKIRMASLNNAKTPEGFDRWVESCGLKGTMVIMVSEKLDGTSLEIQYEDGKLVRGVLRGDGIEGDDITVNVRNMQNVKETLKAKYTGSLHGEIMLMAPDFQKLNKVLEARGTDPLKNPRNGAAGLAGRQDGLYSEYLTVLYYDCTGAMESKEEKLDFIDYLDLQTVWYYLCPNVQEVRELHEDYESKLRAELDHDIDGLVVELDSIPAMEELGDAGGNPKGAIAWKFQPMRAETKLLEVEWSIGNGGNFTPVALLKPVHLGGVTVSRASLYNVEHFNDLQLRKGDTVLVERACDVIPRVVKVVKHSNGDEFMCPEMCPVCSADTIVRGAFLECSNPQCSSLRLGDIKKWVEKVGLKGKGIGEKTLEKLFEKGLIESAADLYALTVENLKSLQGFGVRSAKSFVETLGESKDIPLENFIGGLNIPNFSTDSAKILIDAGYDSLEKMRQTHAAELVEVKGIGPNTATAFIKGIHEKAELVDELFIRGINIVTEEKVEGVLTGKSFCFTGGLEKINPATGKNYKREQAWELVKENGGKVEKSVVKGLTYLVQADPTSTSNKTEKAKKYGTKIISEVAFFEMVGM